jgi:hypothetical protein
MSAWLWVLIALCAAGVLLALVSLIPVITAALRLRTKVRDLQRRPLFLSMQSMQLQAARLSHTAAQAQPLVERGRAAVAAIEQSAAALQLPDAQRELRDAGAELQTLSEELR